jgi:uncharacterized membrane protein HdeD (DUF308 family)
LHAETQYRVSQSGAFLVIFGLLLGMLGVICIASPLATGVAVDMFVGLMALSRGAMQFYYGIKVRHWGHRFGSYMGVGSLFIALLSIAVGVVMLINPFAGLKFLTLMLAVYLVAVGGLEILHSIELSSVRGWGFIMLSGLLSVALGIMIWQQWPLSGQWAIGVIVGSSFLLSGLSLAMLGISGRALVSSFIGEQSVSTS